VCPDVTDVQDPKVVASVAVTMNPTAARRLARVLLRAATTSDGQDTDWLLWAVGRIAQAMKTTEDGPA
jgi:hypothetical protein